MSFAGPYNSVTVQDDANKENRAHFIQLHKSSDSAESIEAVSDTDK